MDNIKNIDIEKVENIEIFESDFDLVAADYLQKIGANNLSDISQAQWNGYLIECNKRIISNINLKSDNYRPIKNSTNNALSNDNSYNIDVLNNIINKYYIPLCMMYSKEISLMGVSFLFGMEYDTLMKWKACEVGSPRLELVKKIINAREESLSNKLSTGKQNPVGVMAILNHHYQWNMPGVRNEKTSSQALTSSDLPTLNCTENTNNLLTQND